MKNLMPIYFVLITILIFSSCDKVEFPYPQQVAEPASCTEPIFDSNLNTQRNVLLEDFTGHRCPNCPGATYNAIQYQNTLEGQGKHLIIVGMHATDLAEPLTSGTEFLSEYRTTDGDNFGNLTNSYSEYFGGATGFAYVPIGLVDRANYNSSNVVDVGDWNNAIDDRFSLPLQANLQMEINYDVAFDKACIYIETEFLQNLGGNYNLVVYVVEDSIVDWQINGLNGDPTYPLDENIEFYMHRHVFRGAVNGTWGASIATGGVTIGQEIVKGYNVDIKPEWNPEHISFVAYVYDDATKEILQVIEQHL